MHAFLGYAGDALWIIALAIMASASRQAWRRLPPGAGIPVALNPDGSAAMTTTRGPALLAVPVLAFIVGAALLFVRPLTGDYALAAIALFAVRATAAAILALAHLRWLRVVLDRSAARDA